jgi:hypothetical protein
MYLMEEIRTTLAVKCFFYRPFFVVTLQSGGYEIRTHESSYALPR